MRSFIITFLLGLSTMAAAKEAGKAPARVSPPMVKPDTPWKDTPFGQEAFELKRRLDAEEITFTEFVDMSAALARKYGHEPFKRLDPQQNADPTAPVRGIIDRLERR